MAFRSHLPEPTTSQSSSTVVPPPIVGPAPTISGLSVSGLPIINATDGHGSKPQSAGWMISMLLHTGLVIVVWLLVAPANLGGVNAIVITMSWSDDKIEESATWVATMEELEPTAEPIAPAPVILPDLSNVAMNDLFGGGVGEGNSDSSPDASGSGSSVGGKASPRGTFFGIEADGHEFVYVVDMSGSMRGHLYEHAIAELIRSIDLLNPTQKFYVTLFSNHAKPMFDDTSPLPQTIAATPENRERLAKWLIEAYDGGGTDPRQAIKLALDMNPSAVFMLSDGEFKERRRRDAGVLTAGDLSTTAALVRTTNATIPIHSIAFENEGSRSNMQELATLTEGTFRFVEVEDQSKRIAESLGEIDEATKLGRHHVAQVFWNELIHSIDLEDIDEELRNQVIQSIVDRGEKALLDEHLLGASLALQSLLEMDPDADFTLEQQTRLLAKYLQLHDARGTQASPLALSETMMTQAKLIQRYPHSKISRVLKSSMSEQLFRQADQLVASDDIAGAFRVLDHIRSLPINPFDRDRALKRQRMVVADQIQIAEQKEQKSGTLVFVLHLVESFANTGPTWLEAGGNEALHNASMRMRAELRDATGTRNLADRDRLRDDIKMASQKSPEFAQAAVDFVRKDRMARGVMNQARRNEQKGQKMVAVKQYQNIVDQYPYSRSIHFARQRLADLTGRPRMPAGDGTDGVNPDSTLTDQINEMFAAKPVKSDQEIARPTMDKHSP